LKCFARTRDYCSPDLLINMYFDLVKSYVESKNFLYVSSYISKIEGMEKALISQPLVSAKLKVFSGVAMMCQGKFKQAARKFIETPFALEGGLSDIVSQTDIAIYGVLCGLAEFDRSELKQRLITFQGENKDFRQYLELMPVLRELIQDFYSSRYTACVTILTRLQNDFMMDMWIGPYIPQLYEAIHSRALIQYCSPFVSVDLTQMATAFATTVDNIELELTELIKAGRISARIDSHNKVLYAKHTDLRNSTFEKALLFGTNYQRHTAAMILRLRLLEKDFVVKPAKGDEAYMQPGMREMAMMSGGMGGGLGGPLSNGMSLGGLGFLGM